MADEEHILVCHPVGEHLPGDPTSVRDHYCTECDAEVWMSPHAIKFQQERPDLRIICAPCSIAMVDDIDEVRALPGDVFGEAVIELMPEIIEQMYGPKDKD